MCILAFAALFLATEFTSPAKRGDNAVQDRILANWPPLTAPNPPAVALVTITEPTLASLPYRSPIDRGLLARTVEILGKAGVKAVAFDILIDQATEPEKDAAFAAAIKAFPGTVVLAWADHRGGLLKTQQEWLDGFIAASGATPGFANLATDADGVVRHFENRLDDTEINSMASALLKAADPDRPVPDSGTIVWRVSSQDKAQAFPTLPASGLLALGRVRPQALTALLGNRMVLVGADLPLVDRHTSSLAASLNPSVPDLTAGVEIHAHVVDQIAQNLTLKRVPDAARYALLAVLAISAGLIGLSGIHFLLKCAGIVLLVGGYAAAAIWSLFTFQMLLPIIQPGFTSIALFAFSLGISSLYLSSDRKFIREAFGHYISPKLVAQMIEQPEMLSVGGQRKDLSFIFSDIAGFTSLSEAITPERLTTLLNDYLGGMSDIVVEHNGIVDKFIGDAVVAIFGAPGDDPDHRQNALNCALAMDRFANDFIARNNDIQMGVTRIGVHSGEAIVGNFGGERRYDYTAMGDTMNIAARLESANKTFGTCLAVSGSVVSKLKEPDRQIIRYDNTVLAPLGDFIFKGKNEPVSVFTPMVHHESNWVDACGEALSLIEAEAPEAPERVAGLLSRYSDEPVLAFHGDRLRRGESGMVVRLTDK